MTVRFTREEAIAAVDRVLAIARRQKNPSAMLAALSVKLALAGTLADQVGPIRTERDLTDDELNDLIEQAANEAGYRLQRMKQ